MRIRLFQAGKVYTVKRNSETIFESNGQTDAEQAYGKIVAALPREALVKRKSKSPIIYRGGLPSLGKKR